MSPVELLSRLLSAAGGGDLPSVTYSAAVSVLRHCGYEYAKDDSGGKYGSWKHPKHRDVLTLREESAARSMHSGYIRKLARHLEKVLGAGGFNAPNDT